ncbi:MAG: segregation/condensation protein A [Clostridiaceae bacterium]|nr:segregation/condensation protein A [Clostridiaceae bacterium]
MKQISFKLEIFEGPLDLLLHLINKNKVSLYDIPISEITEQYIDYLSEMKHFDIEVSSEFLVIAAHLLYIKSKMLLPKYDEQPEEDDPRIELAQRLIEYKRFKQISQYLREKEFAGSNTYCKTGEYIQPLLIDESLSEVTLLHLYNAILEIAGRIKYRKPIPGSRFQSIVGREIVSVFSKVKYILLKLKRVKKIPFIDLFRGVKTKSEAVASFLAVLELVKLNRVKITGSDNMAYQLKYINKRKGAVNTYGNSQVRGDY